MRVTILRADEVVVIDGKRCKLDLSAVDPLIHAVQFDTVLGRGTIEWVPEATDPLEVRDTQGEDALWAAAREAGTPENDISVPVMHKTIRHHRGVTEIADVLQFQPIITLAMDTLSGG